MRAWMLGLIALGACGARTGLTIGGGSGGGRGDGGNGLPDGPVEEGIVDGPVLKGDARNTDCTATRGGTDNGIWCCSTTCGNLCCPETNTCDSCDPNAGLRCDDTHDCRADVNTICCGRALGGLPIAYCLPPSQCGQLRGEIMCDPTMLAPCEATGGSCKRAIGPELAGYYTCQ